MLDALDTPFNRDAPAPVVDKRVAVMGVCGPEFLNGGRRLVEACAELHREECEGRMLNELMSFSPWSDRRTTDLSAIDYPKTKQSN